MHTHNPRLTGNERTGRDEEEDEWMREFWRDEERRKRGEEIRRKWEKGGKRVMERQEETVRADGEQAYSDKWRV